MKVGFIIYLSGLLLMLPLAGIVLVIICMATRQAHSTQNSICNGISPYVNSQFNAVHTANKPDNVEVTQNFFDSRMNFYLKKHYDDKANNIHIVTWNYESKSTSYRYLSEKNVICLFMSDGRKKSVLVETRDVWGNQYEEECNKQDSDSNSDPSDEDFYTPGKAEEWLAQNAVAIERIIKERQTSGGLRFFYPVDKDYIDYISDIAELLENNTGNTVTVSSDNLFIDAQASVEM